MKLAAGLLWVAIIIVGTFISTFIFHLTGPAIVPWSLMLAFIARAITNALDYSQFYGVGVLTRLERYRLPALLISFPISLISLAFLGSVTSAFAIGITATLITVVIAISYTIKLEH